MIEAVVYADQAARHASSLLDRVEIQEGIPDWDFEGTQHTEEMLKSAFPAVKSARRW